MEYVASTRRNPFGIDPPCDRYVPGYGATDADFHVIGDHPGRHGGLSTGIPFTDCPWSELFFSALERAGLIANADLDAGVVTVDRTFLSYLHACEPATPDGTDYAAMEPFFDAELRAITAHVLLPVGERATEHVLGAYTARDARDIDLAALHATELRGSGWLVLPIEEPASWAGSDADDLVAALRTLQQRDYRRESDLGRFRPGGEPYFVR